jgi:LmbE family N-acetylglucosaminyl deacetylase
MGRGELARGTDNAKAANAMNALLEGAEQAAAVLGARVLTAYDLPDNAMDTVPLLDVVKVVEEVIDHVKPHTVYTHHSGDLNVDHELTCRAVLTACRPQGGDSPDILSFEVRSATDYAHGLLSAPPFQPNVWQRLNDDAMKAKMEALHCYGREMREWPHSRSFRAVEALAAHRGAQVGASAAEAFTLLRGIR